MEADELAELRRKLVYYVPLDDHFAVVDQLRAALATALEYARHAEGCNRADGDQYRCRCRWEVEEPALRALLVKRDAP